MGKPHLVLNWVFDVPNQLLTCTLDKDLKYIAHKGGTEGFTKIYKGKETTLTSHEWFEEKFWISDNYGEQVGYFQPDYDRVVIHPKEKREDACPMGVGPDGRYLDHLQRMQAVMEGDDCVIVATTDEKIVFVTPDGGLTILKHIPVDLDSTNYPDRILENPNEFWSTHPQPCAMQPLATGRTMSSHEEMISAGVNISIVDKCREGAWEIPNYPDLFKQTYIY